jgi:hypothetical protein
MLRTASEPPPGAHRVDGGDDRRPLWWYARVIRRLCADGGRLIEFGCGGGRLLEYLIPDFEVFGYDEDPVLRHHCRAAVPDAVILEDWSEAEDEGYDVVVALGRWQGSRSLAAIRRLAAKVARGGVLFLVAPNPGGLAHRLKGSDWYGGAAKLGLLSRGEWMTLMRKASLEVVDIESDGLWDAPYLPFIPAALQRAVSDVPVAVQSYWPISRSLWPAAAGECLLITARKGF